MFHPLKDGRDKISLPFPFFSLFLKLFTIYIYECYLKITLCGKSFIYQKSFRKKKLFKEDSVSVRAARLWEGHQNNILFWVKCRSPKLRCGSKEETSDSKFDIRIDFFFCIASTVWPQCCQMHCTVCVVWCYVGLSLCSDIWLVADHCRWKGSF